MTADQKIARLEIVLDDVEPKVERWIVVPLKIRLDRLHDVLQAAMGWTNSHLREIRSVISDGDRSTLTICLGMVPSTPAKPRYSRRWPRQAPSGSPTSTTSEMVGATRSSSIGSRPFQPASTRRSWPTPRGHVRRKTAAGRSATPISSKPTLTPLTRAISTPSTSSERGSIRSQTPPRIDTRQSNASSEVGLASRAYLADRGTHRMGTLIEALRHNGLGLSLYAKGLDRGRFVWPVSADARWP